MKKLGIIGGLGPMATAYLFELIIEMTDAAKDQEHIEMIIHNCPQIPDRTQFILGKSKDNPLDRMSIVGKELAGQCDVLAIPCITAHYFHSQLEQNIGMPVIHAVKETAKYLKERGISKVGIMATDATVHMNIFKNELDCCGITTLYPDEEGQKKVMHLIYDNVKAGMAIETELFEQVSGQLFEQGAEVIILGCTELSMIKKNERIGAGFLDVTEVLAKICVEKCGKLKEQYRELISK